MEKSDCMEIIEDIDYKLYHSKIRVQRYWIRARVKKILEMVSSCNANVILDVGCGTGVITELIGKDRVVGIDIDKNCIKFATKRVRTKSFVIGDATILPFKNNYFDLVVAAELIEHVDSPLFIKEVKRILKSGGYFILSTPNYLSLWPVVELFWSKCKQRRYDVGEHISKFTCSKLRKLLKKNGFIIEKMETLHFKMLCFVKATST